MRGFYTLILLSVLGACGQNLTISDTCTCGYYTDASGNEYAWPDGSKVNYVVHEDFPANLRAGLTAAAETHNAVLQSTSISVDTTSNAAPDYDLANIQNVSGDGVNGIYFVPEPWPWASSAANSDAMTVILFANNQIVEADIFFRARSFQQTTNTTVTNNGTTASSGSAASKLLSSLHDFTATFQNLGLDLTSDVTKMQTSPDAEKWTYVIGKHEMGHGLGWVHTDQSTDSIMDPSVNLNYVNRAFAPLDITRASRHYAITSEASAAIK